MKWIVDHHNMTLKKYSYFCISSMLGRILPTTTHTCPVVSNPQAMKQILSSIPHCCSQKPFQNLS